MSASFDLPETDHLTAGAVGPPGQRVFYLQAGLNGANVSLRLEKAQVAALCQFLEALMADLPPAGDPPTGLDLVEPVVAEWVVGSLGVSYDEDDDRVVLVAEELVAEVEGQPPAEPAHARIRASREQIAAFIGHGMEVVRSGRPPCPLCGGPIDAEGHVCIRMNGHRDRTP